MTFPCLPSVANKHAGDVIAPHCLKVIHSFNPFPYKMDEPLSFIIFTFVIVIQLLLMHVFYLAILSLMIKLLCIHGQRRFLEYSLHVLMDPQHFVKSGCTVYMYYGELIVTPLEIVK